MAKNNKEKDLVFSSERLESRERLKKIILTAAAVVLVIAIAIAAAFIIRGAKGVRFTGGEDTAFPYSWRNSKKGVMSLEISRGEDTARTWSFIDAASNRIGATLDKKQPKDATRFSVVPKEAGRHNVIFLFTDAAGEASYRMDMLLETTENEKGTFTTEVITASIQERQTSARGGEGTYFPYAFRIDEYGYMVLVAENSSGVFVDDWTCESENDDITTVSGVISDRSGVTVYVLPGTEAGTCRLDLSSQMAKTVISLDTLRTEEGALLVSGHSIEGGTTVPEAITPEPADIPVEGPAPDPAEFSNDPDATVEAEQPNAETLAERENRALEMLEAIRRGEITQFLPEDQPSAQTEP